MATGFDPFLEPPPGGGVGPAGVLGLGVPDPVSDCLGRLAVALSQIQAVVRPVAGGQVGGHGEQVANAMRANGLIETGWEDNQVDGLGAMVGAWRCDALARENGVPISEIDLMNEIIRYNEVDCRVMMEIVRYLRMYH